MKRYLLTLTALLIFSGIALPQTEFTDGYIIKHDGTITYGQVANVVRGYTAQQCTFRWFDLSEVVKFGPDDIAGFGFTYGMRFKSVNDSRRVQFMACLTDGLLDLLYDGSRLYLDGMGMSMVALGREGGSTNVEGKLVHYSDYSDLLQKLPDPEDRFTLPAEIPLNPAGMAEVIAGYNQSRGYRSALYPLKNQKTSHDEIRFGRSVSNSYGLIAGGNASKYIVGRTANNRTRYLPSMDFFEINPLLGVYLTRPLTRRKNPPTVTVAVIAMRTSFYIYEEFKVYSDIVRNDVSVSYTGIKFPVSFRVSLGEGKFSPFLSAGGFFMRSPGAKYVRDFEVEDQYHVVKIFTDETTRIRDPIVGAMAGGGIKLQLDPKRTLSVELRAELGSGLYIDPNFPNISQATLSFNLLASIDLF